MDSRTIQCILVTPEHTVYDRRADFVAMTLLDGEIGIAPGHAPMIGLLGSGEMRIRSTEHTDHYYVEGGFVEVRDNVVSVLTELAVPASAIDEAVVREQLAAAQLSQAATPEAASARQRTVDNCRAKLRVAHGATRG